MVAHLEEAFGQEHERTYGHRAGPDEPVELVAIQLVGPGLRDGGDVPQRVAAEPRRGGSRTRPRRAYFGDARLARDAGDRAAPISAASRDGPLIVEEYDATCLVPPGARAERDAAGNIVISCAG